MLKITSLFGFFSSHFKLQRAWQWWYKRQSSQLSFEAERIRDGLLQETFAMRRSLELFQIKRETSAEYHQVLLKKIEKFHHFLEQLSDRLNPPYLEDSLPLAIQHSLESWQRCDSKLNFQLELPASWSHELPERNRAILMTIDELLRITLAKIEQETSIHIKLSQQRHRGELMVQIYYPDVSTLNSTFDLEDWEYLKQSFQILASGRCDRSRKERTITWYFRWRLQHPDQLVDGEELTK